jgi:positive regulator of sigma E activity
MKKIYKQIIGAITGAVLAWLIISLYLWLIDIIPELNDLAFTAKVISSVLFAIVGWYVAKDYWK